MIYIANVTRSTIWSDNQVLTAAALNGEFNNLLNALNIVNADISASAAIVFSKLDSATVAGVTASQTLTNKTLTTPTITSSASPNPTAIGQLAYDNVTHTLQIGDGSATRTIPDTDQPQTLINKTLTKPTINGSVQGLTADSDSGTITFNLSTSNIHSVTLGGNRTLALSNASVGQVFILRLIQDGSGGRTVSWFSTIHWVGGSAPTLTTTASHWDTIGFICTASNVFDGYIVGANLS